MLKVMKQMINNIRNWITQNIQAVQEFLVAEINKPRNKKRTDNKKFEAESEPYWLKRRWNSSQGNNSQFNAKNVVS